MWLTIVILFPICKTSNTDHIQFAGDNSLLYPPQKQYGLYQQDQWQSISKIPMPGLVMEKNHSKKRADGTTDDCSSEKNLFRNPPPMFYRLSLIYAIQNECDKIYDKEIIKQIFHIQFLILSMASLIIPSISAPTISRPSAVIDTQSSMPKNVCAKVFT